MLAAAIANRPPRTTLFNVTRTRPHPRAPVDDSLHHTGLAAVRRVRVRGGTDATGMCSASAIADRTEAVSQRSGVYQITTEAVRG